MQQSLFGDAVEIDFTPLSSWAFSNARLRPEPPWPWAIPHSRSMIIKTCFPTRRCWNSLRAKENKAGYESRDIRDVANSDQGGETCSGGPETARKPFDIRPLTSDAPSIPRNCLVHQRPYLSRSKGKPFPAPSPRSCGQTDRDDPSPSNRTSWPFEPYRARCEILGSNTGHQGCQHREASRPTSPS